MESSQLKNILEAALLAAGRPLSIDQLIALFGDANAPEKKELREALKELQADYEGRGIELIEVASGFRVQVRDAMSQWLSKLWEERPPRYSRALMETLAIIAYRQPVTRGDIEEIRGVAVTSNIIRTLLERDWIKVVGHRDVPGKPAMFGTTRGFLDYFGLKKLDDLPPLAELATLEPVGVQLQIEGTDPDAAPVSGEETNEDDSAGNDEASASASEDADDQAEPADDRPPGAVQPLVGLNAPGTEAPEPATVSSIDSARVPVDAESKDESSSDDAAPTARVVPLKSS